MPKFKNGKIYKMTNRIDDQIYVGSTCQYLKYRLCGHKCKAKDGNSSKLYHLMRTYGIENFEIVLIESYECENLKELRRREQYYIDLLKPTLNTMKALIEDEERARVQREYMQKYSKNNRETINEQHRIYFQQNKELVYKHQKKWNAKNPEKIKAIKAKWSQKKFIAIHVR